MTNHPAAAIVALIFAAASTAQVPAIVSPLGAAITLGPSNNNIPFSWTPTAYQQVHSVTSFTSRTPAAITSLRLRMANGFTNVPGQTIDVEIWMSESPNAASSASATFANNIVASTEVNVIPRANILLPTVPDNSWAVAPFAPFAVPFVFSGLAHVSWRAIVWGNSNNNMSFTYPLDAFSMTGSSGNTGNVAAGCQSANGGTRPAEMFTGTPVLGTNVLFAGASFVATGGMPALLTLGVSATDFNGIPLPFDLGIAGAPGCFLYNDWVSVLVGVTRPDANGTLAIILPMPNDNSLTGAHFYSQFLFAQIGANALGLFASNGRFLLFGSPPGITRIYAIGNPSATSGTLGMNYGMSIGLN